MKRVVDAVYVKHPVDTFNGNPLTEALRIEISKDSLLAQVTNGFNCQDNFWQLPEFYQLSLIQSLGGIHEPDVRFSNFYYKLMSMILYSYSLRDPFSPENMQLRMSLGEKLNEKKCKFSEQHIQFDRTTAPSMLVSGPSATGKTTLIRRALAQTVQVIRHSKYEGAEYRQIQVVWLSIDMPATASIKALALNFFKAVDKATGTTNYFRSWENKNHRSVDAHLFGIQLVAEIHQLGLIHIDEIQFMLAYGKSKESPTFQILEALFNKVGVPIILSCTDHGLRLFETTKFIENTSVQEITTLRRMLSDKEYRLSNYKQSAGAFENLVNAMYPEVILLNCIELTPEFYDVFYELTVGVPQFMVRLAQLHHELLVYRYHDPAVNNQEVVTSDTELLRLVFASQFRLYETAINYLRVEDLHSYEEEIDKCKDQQEQDCDFSIHDKVKISKQIEKKKAAKIKRGAKADNVQRKISSITTVDMPFLTGIEGE